MFGRNTSYGVFVQYRSGEGLPKFEARAYVGAGRATKLRLHSTCKTYTNDAIVGGVALITLRMYSTEELEDTGEDISV